MSMLVLLLTLASAATTPEVVLARAGEAKALAGILLDRTAPAISDDTYRRAAAGEIVTGVVEVAGQAAKKAWGVGVFDVPIARYWAAINDDNSKVEWTALDYLEILQGRVCEAPRRVFQFLPVPLLTDRWWVVNVRYNEALFTQTNGRMREQTWATNGDFTLPTATAQAWGAKGMHVESTSGSWLLVDLDGRHTLVKYSTWADPGGSVPMSLVNSIAASGVDDTMENMAALAKKGTTCALR